MVPRLYTASHKGCGRKGNDQRNQGCQAFGGEPLDELQVCDDVTDNPLPASPLSEQSVAQGGSGSTVAGHKGGEMVETVTVDVA